MSTGFGKSLVRNKKREAAERRKNYVTVLESRNLAAAETHARRGVDGEIQQAGSTGGAGAHLKSVWETSNIESFLQMADARQAGYNADRAVKVVVDGAAHVVVGNKVTPLSDDQRDWLALSAKLPIPKRPDWDFDMTAQDIDVHELSAFAEWRLSLNEIEESTKIILSPYEKNLEVWRQLWRVVERSDVVVNVVDARNPLAFRCLDFERYASSHVGATGRRKPVVLLLNKADLLTQRQRESWASYLNSQGVIFYFFSAKPGGATAAELLQQEQQLQQQQAAEAAKKAKKSKNQNQRTAGDDEDNSTSSDDDDDDDDDANVDPGLKQNLRRQKMMQKQQQQQEDASTESEQQQQAPATEGSSTNNKKSGRRAGKHRALRGVPQQQMNDYERYQQHQYSSETSEAPSTKKNAEKNQQQQKKPLPKKQELKNLPPLSTLPPGTEKIYAAEELVDVFGTLWRERVCAPASSPASSSTASEPQAPQLQQQPMVMVGFVGYPNVGKSSTINALIGSKKVVVSATPGKTKHFQTLPIPNEDRVMLCDCPGLVFPTCAATKDTMVCDGVLPIDNCRDFVSPIAILCRRVPKYVIEEHYHVEIDPANDIDHSSSPAEVVLAFIARRRGYMTDHSRPNRSRAARDVLKDFVDGRMVYVHPPPNFTGIPPTCKTTNKDGDDWGTVGQFAYELVNAASAAAAYQQQMKLKMQQEDTMFDDDDEIVVSRNNNGNRNGGDDNDDQYDDDDDDDDDDEDEEEGADWEDVDSELDEARDLSDDESDDEDDPQYIAAMITHQKLTSGAQFFDHSRSSAIGSSASSQQQQQRRLASATILSPEEQFNLRPDIIEKSVRSAAENSKLEQITKRRKRKMKAHQALVVAQPDPDTTVRITSRGMKQVVFDEDDDIDVFVKVPPSSSSNNNNKQQQKGGGGEGGASSNPPQNATSGRGGGGGGGGASRTVTTSSGEQKRLSKRQLRRLEKKQGVMTTSGGPGGVTKRGVVTGAPQK